MSTESNLSFPKWFAEHVAIKDKYLVYAMYNDAGETIYIGVTSYLNLKQRMQAHYNSAPFFHEVARVAVVFKAETKREALDKEWDLISSNPPRYNKDKRELYHPTPDVFRRPPLAEQEKIVDCILNGEPCTKVSRDYGISRQRVSQLFEEFIGVSIRQFRYFEKEERRAEEII